MFNCLAPNIKGKDGAVSLSNIQSSTLDKQSKQRFPLELLKIMKRKAEDLLLATKESLWQKSFKVHHRCSGRENKC